MWTWAIHHEELSYYNADEIYEADSEGDMQVVRRRNGGQMRAYSLFALISFRRLRKYFLALCMPNYGEGNEIKRVAGKWILWMGKEVSEWKTTVDEKRTLVTG